jgi:hypothetical protein
MGAHQQLSQCQGEPGYIRYFAHAQLPEVRDVLTDS